MNLSKLSEDKELFSGVPTKENILLTIYITTGYIKFFNKIYCYNRNYSKYKK